MFNKISVLRTVRARAIAVAAAVTAAAGSASAAVPAEVTTALADMKADGLVVAGAVLVAIIAISAVKFIRKGL